MKSLKVKRALGAGLAGTLVMTVVTMLAPTMGLPKMDIAAMLGSVLTGTPPAPGTSSWLVGFAMHVIIGTAVLSTGYALLQSKLPTASALANGLIYGVLVWVVAQAMVMPMMGAGLFSSHLPHGGMMAVGSLMGHLIYGAVLGVLYGAGRTDNPARDLSILRA